MSDSDSMCGCKSAVSEVSLSCFCFHLFFSAKARISFTEQKEVKVNYLSSGLCDLLLQICKDMIKALQRG